MAGRAPLSLGLVVLAAGACLAAPPAAARPCRPTLADYRAIKVGDGLKSVTARLGCRGRKIDTLAYGRKRRVTYSWRGRGDFGANLTLTFTNGRLSDKSQLGLE